MIYVTVLLYTYNITTMVQLCCVFTGAVYDYNEKGVNRSLEGWDQCVCVPVLQQYDEKCIALWDQKLEQHSAYNTWHPER